jgi:peptide-methionine (R)-S-oxide reductase
MADRHPNDDAAHEAAIANASPETLRTDAFWRDKLTPAEFAICRQKGTERPFTGAYFRVAKSGIYQCRCCKTALFRVEAQFDSGCGWPSFFAPLEASFIRESFDDSHGMRRTEILCRRCHCHLGHVFTDGPEPTGLRYCVNSASIHLIATANPA